MCTEKRQPRVDMTQMNRNDNVTEKIIRKWLLWFLVMQEVGEKKWNHQVTGWKQQQKGTFSSSTVKLWNSLPKHILNAGNFHMFKNQQSQFMEASPPHLLSSERTPSTLLSYGLLEAGTTYQGRTIVCLPCYYNFPRHSVHDCCQKNRYRLDGFYYPSKKCLRGLKKELCK